MVYSQLVAATAQLITPSGTIVSRQFLAQHQLNSQPGIAVCLVVSLRWHGCSPLQLLLPTAPTAVVFYGTSFHRLHAGMHALIRAFICVLVG